MPTNALTNSLVLPLLGVLVEGPRHAYAVLVELRARYAHMAVRSGTVYTLIERLQSENWITSNDSLSPAVLEATPDGVRALEQTVRRELLDGDLNSGHRFATALAYLGILDKRDARDLLTGRAAVVRREVARIDHLLSSVDAPRLHMIEASYLRSKLVHDATWLEETVNAIDRGDLVWIRGGRGGDF